MLLDPFEPEFMQRALAAGLLAVVAASVVGTWVVLRGLSFLGDALAHGVIPGLALAVLWGFNLTIGALASAAVMVGGVNLVNRRSRLGDDTGIGLLFVGMLALGVVVISKSRSFATDVQALLFGDVLGVTEADLRVQAAAAVAVLVGSAVGYRAFVALAFNEAKAGSLGLRPGATHLTLLALIAVAIVASFQAVGTLLVFGLLVGPPRHGRAARTEDLGVHGGRGGPRLGRRLRRAPAQLPPRHGGRRHDGGGVGRVVLRGPPGTGGRGPRPTALLMLQPACRHCDAGAGRGTGER